MRAADHIIITSSRYQKWESIFSRLLVWGMIFGSLYILRSFFLLIFFTFVFAYLQTSGVNLLVKWIKNRTVRVILSASMMLIVLITVALFLIPKVKKQTEVFISQFSTYISRLDQELIKLIETYPFLKEIVPELSQKDENGLTPSKKGFKESVTILLFQQAIGKQDIKINQILETIGGISGKVASIGSAFLLSLLFSFLIVLDLPSLAKGVQGLQQTKLRFIYNEAAVNIKEFSQVMGKALEAQFLIAVVNSILTAAGIYVLGLGKNVAFLSVIVFLCSFIPIIGVFISSIPICLMALQVSGLNTMLLAILLIVIIHLIEGYLLNPKIYGSYMRINPVIVLIILTIAGKLFQFWGLILGVPVCTYIFGYAIQNNPAAETQIPEIRCKEIHT